MKASLLSPGSVQAAQEYSDLLDRVVPEVHDHLVRAGREWLLGGTPIDDVGWRREAFNMLSMPRA